MVCTTLPSKVGQFRVPTTASADRNAGVARTGRNSLGVVGPMQFGDITSGNPAMAVHREGRGAGLRRTGISAPCRQTGD